jgi:hypothetical protein
MADIDLSFLLRILREIQAEIRTLHGENARINQELTTKAGRSEIFLIINRIAEFEAHMESRFDDLQTRFDNLERRQRSEDGSR